MMYDNNDHATLHARTACNNECTMCRKHGRSMTNRLLWILYGMASSLSFFVLQTNVNFVVVEYREYGEKGFSYKKSQAMK